MPIINLDTAFGARVTQRLRDDKAGWLTTVGAKTGTPAPNPVWFVWNDDTVLIFSQRDRSKLVNIAANARVTFHLDSDRRGSDAMIISGTAKIIYGDVADADLSAFTSKYADDMRRIGFSPDEFYAEYAVPIRIEADRIRGF